MGALTPELREFLDANPVGVLATAASDGGPRQWLVGAPTALIAQRMTGADEPPEPMSDEALAGAGRVILAITIERVSGANYIEPADAAGEQTR